MKTSLHYLAAVSVLLLVSASCSTDETPPRHVSPTTGEPLGEALFRERCRDCHKIRKTGGGIGPDLATAKKRTPCFVEAVIRNPSHAFPGTVMPKYRDLSVRQVNSLVQLVTTLK